MSLVTVLETKRFVNLVLFIRSSLLVSVCEIHKEVHGRGSPNCYVQVAWPRTCPHIACNMTQKLKMPSVLSGWSPNETSNLSNVTTHSNHLLPSKTPTVTHSYDHSAQT